MDVSEYGKAAQGMPRDTIVSRGPAAAAQGRPVTDVVFDFGNVLTIWNPRMALIGRYGDEAIDAFLDNSVSGFVDAYSMVDAGATTEEACEWMARTHGERWASMYRYYCANFEDTLIGSVPGSRKLVLDIRNAGLGVWGLSNWGFEDFPVARRVFPSLQLLADYVVSGFVKVRKPYPQIYRMAYERFGIDPAGAVFIDDKPENIVGANETGMRGICFGGDPRALRRALADAGVPIPRGDAHPGDEVAA